MAALRKALAAMSVGFGLALAATATAEAPSAELYERSLGLRENWRTLTVGLADPARWIDNDRFYYRRSVPGGFEFVISDVATRTPRPAFDHDRLAQALGRAAGATYSGRDLPFTTFDYAEGETAIRVQVESNIWVCRLGDAYACEAGRSPWSQGRPRGFGVVRDLSVPADNTPRRSPDGRYEAFVQGDNIAVRTVADGRVRVLSRDGSPGDFYDPQTIVWAPDSSAFAAYQVRPGYRREVLRVETSPRDQVQPRLQTQLYPKPGDAVDIERPVIFHADTGRQVDVAADLIPNPYQLSPMTFRADSRTLSFRYTERGHQRVRVIEADARTGAARAVIDESTDTFINGGRALAHDVGNLGREIVWMSERDGWNHLYLHDTATGRARQITRGEWVVRSVAKVDDERRQIWFAASGREAGDPYFQHYYRIDFDGRNLVRLTQADAWHDVSFSPDMRHYVDTWSRVDLPNVSELRSAADGALVAELERADITALTAAGFRPPEVFTAPGRDGATPIWGIVVRPRDYDPSRTYPVIENIYAGPHDSFVPKTFWPFGYHSGGDKVIGMQALADLGFIVVQIDGMGTLNRSKAFHDVAWKNLGDSGFPDRIAWHRALAARDPSYDLSRGVGIYGASAGGQSALGALLFHSDFYSVAVAYNGCYDNRMDKISWNEQWMGWPVDDSYSRASGVDNAHRLQGRLLLIVGEQDSNVDPASTYQVADALIRAGKDFDLLALPGEGHAVGRSEGPIDYAHRRQFDFFVRHLLGERTPDWNRSATAAQ